MYVLKLFLVFILFFSFVSCKRGANYCSTSYDKRCYKIQEEYWDKGEETGVCYSGPELGNILFADDADQLHPDPEACNALTVEALAKCDALPPPGPGDVVKTSGSTFYKDGKPVMKDGKPVCVPD